MALLTNQATLAYACFDRDELEQMLQWRVIQEGTFVEVKHGVYAHLYDQARRMHWLHYMEDEEREGEDEGVRSWRLDLHIDAGRYTARFDVPLEDFFADSDARFSLTTPMLLAGDGEDLPILVELVNKNMIDGRKETNEAFDINLSFSVLEMDVFASRQEWQTQVSPDQEGMTDLFPIGLAVEEMMRDGEHVEDEVIGIFKHIAEDLRINPIQVCNLAGVVQKVDVVPLGNNIVYYDVTVETSAGSFRLPVPEVFLEAGDLEPGVFISTLGFFSGLYLNDISERETPNLNAH